MEKHLPSIITTLLTFFAPAEAAAAAVFVLAFVDMITGILAARKEGKPITSARMRDSISKVLIYETALLAAFVAEKVLLSNVLPVSKLVSALLGSVELKSILENLNRINGSDIFAAIIQQLGSKNKEK